MTTMRFGHLQPLHAGCHIGRGFYRPGRACGSHDHDFAEAMWVEHGAVLQLTAQGSSVLRSGDLITVRPGHRHDIRGLDGASGVIFNIAIDPTDLRPLEERYGTALWGDGDQPRRLTVGIEAVAALSRRAEALRRGAGDRLAREAFLVGLFDRLRPGRMPAWRDAPAWLAAALESLCEPPLLAEGLPALARLTGRSREHVSRSIRLHCDRSATGLLTEMRLEWAERELALADTPVAVIASTCGIGRARLHRLFRERYGRGPRDYRVACRGAVG